MDLVADTSVIIAVTANEPEKAALVKRTAGADLIAPPSVHWEIGNAFSLMLKRKRVTIAQVQEAIEAYGKIPIRFVDVSLRRSLELAGRLGIYAYDAYLLACAQEHRCPLLTLDRGLARAAKRMGIDLWEVRP